MKLLLSILCHQILMLKTQVQEWMFFSLSIPWQLILVYNRITNMSRLEMSYTGKILLYLYIFSVSFRAWIVLKRSYWQDFMSYFDFLILSLNLKNMENQLTYKILKTLIILETFKIKKYFMLNPNVTYF